VPVVRRLILPVLLVALLVGCTNSNRGAEGSKMDGAYAALDGSTTSVAAYRGTPVLVNFFASTCQPCLREMPALEQVKQEAAGKVRFVGIDVGDTVAGTRSFVEAVGVTWDIGRDPDGALIASVGGSGLPTTVVLDAEGTVVFSHRGALELDQLRAELQSRGYL
ncbi:MAG: TlpA disulfide reductase family protein, partial [Acidimicrobiales bacterium]